jgi:nucleotide-binding universal stress UspA family protein
VNSRFRYTTKPLPLRTAKRWRKAEIEVAEERIAQLQAELGIEVADLAALRDAPLATTYEVEEEVKQGEPGWDELPNVFYPPNLQGNFQWINTPAQP